MAIEPTCPWAQPGLHPRQEPKSGRQGSRLSGRSGFGQIQSPDKDVDFRVLLKAERN